MKKEEKKKKKKRKINRKATESLYINN